MWAKPFDRNIWSFFIYSFFCARPFDQKLGSILIYSFYLHTTIRQIIWSSFIYSFFSARPFDQKLGSLLIYFIHLQKIIPQKYMIVFVSVILSLCRTIRPKNRVLINYNLFFYLYTTIGQVRGHSYSIIYSFLRCANISFAIFMADTALIFALLCFWPNCL